MDLDLKGSPKVKVRYEGNEYSLSKPTLGDALKLESDIEASESGTKKTAVIIDFISSRGLPREVLLSFEVDMLDAVVQALLPTKKKS